jgi:hypothetical protein
METKEQLQNELKTIEAWEKDQDDLFIWEKIGRIPFAILDKLAPKKVHEKINAVISEMAKYIETGGQYLVEEKNVHRLFEGKAQSPIIDCPLTLMDEIAGEIKKRNKTMATAQGAATGFGGVFTLAADIPASLGLSLKVIQEIAICYGFDPKSEDERAFVLQCFQFANSDIVGKKAILKDIANQDAALSKIKGWHEVIQSYRDNFGMKKLFQMIPVAGLVFGALFNRSMIDGVAETAMMMYKKRRVVERLSQIDNT